MVERSRARSGLDHGHEWRRRSSFVGAAPPRARPRSRGRRAPDWSSWAISSAKGRWRVPHEPAAAQFTPLNLGDRADSECW